MTATIIFWAFEIFAWVVWGTVGTLVILWILGFLFSIKEDKSLREKYIQTIKRIFKKVWNFIYWVIVWVIVISLTVSFLWWGLTRESDGPPDYYYDRPGRLR